MKLVRSYQKTWTDNNDVYAFSFLSRCIQLPLTNCANCLRRHAFPLFSYTENECVCHTIRWHCCWSFFRFHDFCAFFHHKSIYIKNFSFILPIAVSSFNSYLNKYFNCALLKRYCVHRAFQSLYYVYRRNDRNKSGPVSHVSRPTKH